MAIVAAVKEETQSRTAMKKVMDYVAQDYKILFQNENGEQCRLLPGQNCCGETAFQLIDNVAVHEQTDKDGHKSQSIQVKYNFVGCLS